MERRLKEEMVAEKLWDRFVSGEIDAREVKHLFDNHKELA